MSEMMRDQTPAEDMLVDRGVDDLLDEGYSPPERLPATHERGTTAEEMRDGETLDERVVQEEPEADPYVVAESEEAVVAWEASEPDARAGRLVAPDEGAHEDAEKDEVAFDAGIDAGAASAEEAAVHVVSEDVVVAGAMPDDEL